MKRMKFTEKEETNDVAMKITNLNDHCLKHIFDFLCLEDLLNVAQSNTRLQYIALLSFKYKYGRKTLVAEDRYFIRYKDEYIEEI